MTGHGITIVFQVIGLLTALRTTSGKRFTVVSTGSPVPATLGNDSYLCCRLEPEISAENMTIKFHVGDYNICLYKNGKEDLSNQNETYKDRVELLTENITVGQVTLWIKNIQQSDTGNYTCTFVSDDFSSIATMELHVNKRFEVKATEKTVIATNGGAADLGCHLDPENSAELMTIKFHRGDPKSYVYVYNKNPADSGTQNETYKDRTELLTENITRGQVVVRIKNVQLSDTGNYTCIFYSKDHYSKTTVELKVTERFEVKATEKTVIATNGGAADLGCHLDPENSAELMTIKFHRGDPKSYVYVYNKNPADSGTENETYKDRTELLTENITRGQVVVRIKNVQLSDTGNYTCIFYSKDHYSSTTVELKVTAPGGTMITVMIIIAGLLFLGIMFLVIACKTFKKGLVRNRREAVPVQEIPLNSMSTPVNNNSDPGENDALKDN
ncbi:V-set domain containing T-cell activation inhibitor 1-like [Xenopus laevis]|uniref:V-set domain containing T-cell activation inhibitor 1-like n=1 Tax=Xenopus laevis TaxID=8355 RepID=A0A8J1LLQ3_XENLA|nr:V-set domain containing T-cell activation inhibitor 1-like [Xenopus laevis]